jgi:hypothetical protein
MKYLITYTIRDYEKDLRGIETTHSTVVERNAVIKPGDITDIRKALEGERRECIVTNFQRFEEV